MIGRNLKYYRLKNHMTSKALADKTGVTAMSISNYENDKRNPDMDTLKKLAAALNVRVMDFLTARSEELHFKHGEFRKQSSLGKINQEYIHESVEEYFNRFFLIVNILGSTTVLPQAKKIHVLELVDDLEICARSLREWLNLSVDGPVTNLVSLLENNGILIYLIDYDNRKFSGINGIVDGWPYITINMNMSPERQRFTIAHELVHIGFDWSGKNHLSEIEIEQITNGIAGAFLFPAKDAVRELGIRRAGIQADMQIAAKEFGVSMICLAYRAKELDIVTQSTYKTFMVEASKCGWRTKEPSRIEPEDSNLFKQLVYRAIEEDEINIQRGAELLKVEYQQIRDDLGQLFLRSQPCT